MTKRILVGKIATAHGIKGFVKLDVYADNEDLLNGKIYTAENGNDALTLSFKNRIGNQIVASVDGVSDRNRAEELRGTPLYVDRDTLPEPDDGEFYYEDLIGMTVVDETGGAIGTVLGIDNFGAGDLLDIRKDGGGESFYLLFTDDTVLNIDLDARVITAQLPEEI